MPMAAALGTRLAPVIMSNPALDPGAPEQDLEISEIPAGAVRGSRYWIGAILLLAAVLRLWGLERNGYGNRYYSAGVRSMLESRHNFFFNAFDPAGFVSLDKPPVAFWLQVLSAKLLGFGGFSVLLPQALEGVAAVAVLYAVVRRGFGVRAGLLAAFFLAITPIAIADDRSSNADSCLVLVLLLAAWALLGAVRSGRRLLLLGAAVILGIGFNVKMLAAFVVLPVFVLVYFVYAPVRLWRRLADLALAAAVLAAVSLSWTAAYDLTAPDQRPFAGSTADNSMLELVLGHNGFQRFIRRGGSDAETAQAASPQAAPEAAEGGAMEGEGDFSVPPGPLRLLDPRLSSQILWFLPLVAFGAWVLLRQGVRTLRADAAFWLGWLVIYGIVYSGLARLPSYYLNALGPAVAALAGIGGTALLSWIADRRRRVPWLAAALLSLAVWQVYVEVGFFRQAAASIDPGVAAVPERPTGLLVAVVLGAVSTAAAIAVARSLKLEARRRLVLAAQSVGAAVFLLNPAVWALGGLAATNNDARPQVDITGVFQPAQGLQRVDAGSGKLIAFLQANRGDSRFLLATLSARQAAPVIISTGQPVAALGGFSGTDPIVTPDALARMVAEKQVRYVMLGGARMNGFGVVAPGADQRTAIEDWVRQHGAPVDPGEWREPRPDNAAYPRVRRRRTAATPDQRPAPTELYDLAAAPAAN